jgi:gliding motility-associatede transport system auxiliary component
MERRAKAATETGVYVAIIAVILVVVNLIAYLGIHKRFDVTKNQRYTLSQGSARLVGTLKSPLHVDAYVTKGLPKLDAFVRDLTDLLKLYQGHGGGKFEYSIIEAKSEEQRAAAKEAGLRDLAFGEASETGEDQASISQGYMGLVFKYGSEKDTIPVISPDHSDGLEFWITNKIRDLRDKADNVHHKIGVISQHDEIKISDGNLVPAQGRGGSPSIKSIIDQNFPFYKIEDVDLKGGETEISKELDGIIITQPGKDYTDKELRRIDQFLMEGNKSLVVYASAVNLKASDGSMKATLSTHNLDKLLAGYGVEMKKDAVLDWKRSIQIPVPTETGRLVVIREPAIVQVQQDARLDADHQMLDDSFAGFFRVDELSFPFPSSLVVHPEKQPEAKVKVVARTMPGAAWSENSDTVELKMSPTWKPKPPLEQKNIAVNVEGTLKAAMGSGDGIEVPTASKDKSRILIVSAAQFLANPFARAGAGQELGGQFAMMGPVGGDEQLQMIAGPYAQKYLTGTILSFKNTLDWMSGDSDLIAASAKILQEPNLSYADISPPKIDASDDENSLKKKDEEYRNARKNTQSRVQLLLTLLCPALFAGFGVFRWRQREGGRAKISLD